MAKNHALYLSYNNQEDVFEFPVLPADLGPKRSGDGEGYEVYGLGKINAIKAPELAELTIKSRFPASWAPYLNVSVEELHEPSYYLNKIDKWWKTKRPVRLNYFGDSVDINMAVSIESFEWQEVAGAPGDIEFTLDLKEYRFYAAKKVQVKTSSSGTKTVQKQASSRSSDKVTPKTYTVVSGDSLWKIAKKVLGDGSRWTEIQTLNSLTAAQVKNLKVGQKLKIPS